MKEAQIGDTLYLQEQPVEALPGFKPAKAMVFAGKKLLLSATASSFLIKISLQNKNKKLKLIKIILKQRLTALS